MGKRKLVVDRKKPKITYKKMTWKKINDTKDANEPRGGDRVWEYEMRTVAESIDDPCREGSVNTCTLFFWSGEEAEDPRA